MTSDKTLAMVFAAESWLRVALLVGGSVLVGLLAHLLLSV
jgi:hypothetical protein